jgi:hypothetical protein
MHGAYFIAWGVEEDIWRWSNEAGSALKHKRRDDPTRRNEGQLAAEGLDLLALASELFTLWRDTN